MITVIDDTLLMSVTDEAKVSPRLRKNYNFHQSLDEKCQRFLNAVEPGTIVPIHKHKEKDETFVLLRGKVKVSIYDDMGNVLESHLLGKDEGKYGVNIAKNIWHSLECLEPDSIFFEAKEGPYDPNNKDDVLNLLRETNV